MRNSLFATIAIIATSVPASAQVPIYGVDSPIIDYNFLSGTLGRAVESPNTDVAQQLEQRAPVSRNANLTFTPNAQLRAKHLAQFVSKARRGDPNGAAEMERLFASTDVIGQLDNVMRPMGLRANNVADAYTIWWIAAWHAVNKLPVAPDSATIASVKNQAENALRTSPEMLSATNAQKQEVAEALLVQAALIDAMIDDAAGNPTKQSALAKAVNQGAKAMSPDLDLTKMTLTQDGFVKRSGGRSDAGDVSGDGSQLAATEEDGSNLALYAVAGTGLLAGVFALGKGLAKKG